MIPAILAAVLEAIGITSSVLGIVQAIRNILLGEQLNTDLVTAEEQIALMYGILTNGTYGNPAIATAIASLTPTTLPTIPPPGYGADETVIAAAVWAYSASFPNFAPAEQWLTYAGSYARRIDVNGLQVSRVNPIFAMTGWTSDGMGSDSIAIWPTVEVTSILADDTVYSWLTREEPTWSWSAFFAEGLWGADNPGGSQFAGALCIYTAADFEGVKRNLGLKSSGGSPLWPGLANVILGTPVALTPSLSITGDMDGVLVQALTPSAPKPTTNFGGINNYRAVGGLSFLTDDGEAETIQALGFENQVYVPITMTHASGVIFKCDTTVDATVTPWTLA